MYSKMKRKTLKFIILLVALLGATSIYNSVKKTMDFNLKQLNLRNMKLHQFERKCSSTIQDPLVTDQPHDTDKIISSRRPLVHSISILNRTTFILFSYRFQGNHILHCTKNGKKISGRKIGKNMFQCLKEIDILEEDILSVETISRTVLPSIVQWKKRIGFRSKIRVRFPLCIISMVKNEEPRIVDWLEYHMRQGVKAFLIYDNNSTDNTHAVIQKYKEVTVIDWPWHKTKVQALIHGILYVRHVCDWALFIDVDEYVFPLSQTLTVQQVFTNFPNWMKRKNQLQVPANVNQICLETKVMGTSGYIKCPNLTAPEAYIHFDQWWYPVFGKCAIRPTMSLLKTTIHRFTVKGNTFVLPRDSPHLVHYKYQCWEYFMTKYDKGWASYNKDWDKKKLNPSKPHKQWLKKPGPVDTAFRDYKRKIDQWPLPK